MNWLAKGKLGLIAISASFLFSCESDDLLSLDFDPNEENINLSYTELTLPFQLVQIDSISTTYAGNLMVGNYQNPDFGRIEAKSYLSLGISNRRSATADDGLDSLVLTMVRNYFYGSDAAGLLQTVELHQLTEVVNDTITYYSNSSIPYNPAPIGSVTYNVNPGSNDTLRVRLSDALGIDMLNRLKAGAAEMDSSLLFEQYFKGLALVASAENQFVTGFVPGSIRMNMYFSAPADTASKVFSFGISAVRGPGNNSLPLVFNQISYDRSGTAIATINQPGTVGSPADNRFYLQSGTGLIPRINFQPLVDFVENRENRVLLNRVNLYIGLQELQVYKRPPTQLQGQLVQDDGISLIFNARDPQTGRPTSSGMYNDASYRYDQQARSPVPQPASAILYDTTSMAYQLKITSFTQSLMDGYVDNPEVLLYPSNFSSSLNQIVTSADSVRLKIFYTTLR